MNLKSSDNKQVFFINLAQKRYKRVCAVTSIEKKTYTALS
jgi:hypothetical protein